MVCATEAVDPASGLGGHTPFPPLIPTNMPRDGIRADSAQRPGVYVLPRVGIGQVLFRRTGV